MTAPKNIASYEPDLHHAFEVALASGELKIPFASERLARGARARMYTFLNALRRSGEAENVQTANRFGQIVIQIEGSAVFMRDRDKYGLGAALRASLEAVGALATPDWAKNMEAPKVTSQDDVVGDMMEEYFSGGKAPK